MKKVLSLVLCLALSLFFVVGCSSDNEQPTPPENGQEEQLPEEQTPAEGEDVAEETEEAADTEEPALEETEEAAEEADEAEAEEASEEENTAK